MDIYSDYIRMRVISGKAKGIVLAAVDSKRTRPILDRVKESLFNILGDAVIDSVVLDLFAGTGSLGIEALSRGARMCFFVDKGQHPVRVIGKNLRATGFASNAIVLRKNIFTLVDFLTSQDIKFDIILVAPPYKLIEPGCKDRIKIITLLNRCINVLNENGIIMLQHHTKQTLSRDEFERIIITGERCYGNTQLTFFSMESLDNQR